MKKIFVIAMALMMVAGMAYAEDRLSLNGEFFIRGWDQEGYSGKYAHSYDSDDEASWWEQRLRIGGKIAVADDVSVNFRMDIGEGVWGLDYSPGSVARPGATGVGRSGNTKLDVDRAFLKIDKDMWELTAGQQYMGLGTTQVFDVNATGFNLGFKFNENMKLSVLYAKIDENGSTQDDEYAADVYNINDATVDAAGNIVNPTARYLAGDSNEDEERYAVNFSYTADAFNAKVFYVMGNDDTDVEDSPWALGVNGGMALGMLNLQGELAYLGGDTLDGTVDYSGLQVFVGADAALTEMIKLGAEIFWAAGDDEDIQLTNLGDWDTFTPMGYNTPESGFITGMPSWDVYDPFGTGAGVMGGTLFADLNLTEGLSAGVKLGYFEAEEDDVTDGDLMTYNAWIKYMIASNTNVALTYIVSDPDVDGVETDESKSLIARLSVNF